MDSKFRNTTCLIMKLFEILIMALFNHMIKELCDMPSAILRPN